MQSDKPKRTEEDSALYKLAVQAEEDSNKWFGDTTGGSVTHYALALAGEVGEFCNIIKKIERGSLDIRDAKTRYALSEELADTFTYLLCLAGRMHIDLEQLYYHKRGINESRFSLERQKREAKKNES